MAHMRCTNVGPKVSGSTPGTGPAPSAPSECGTYTTVRTGFWPSLSGQRPKNVSDCSLDEQKTARSAQGQSLDSGNGFSPICTRASTFSRVTRALPGSQVTSALPGTRQEVASRPWYNICMGESTASSQSPRTAARGSPVVRIHFIIEMIWWTGLAP